MAAKESDMSQSLMTIYTAPEYAEAEMIHEALEAEGVESFIDPTPSPLDGLNSMGQGTPIMVNSEDAERARRVIETFLAERASDEEE